MWSTVGLESPQQSPSMRSKSASCVLGNRWYIFGGLGCGASNALWVLDLELKRWQRVPACGPAPVARSSATLVGSHGKIYLFGGLGHVSRGPDRTREAGGAARIRSTVQRETFADVWIFEATSQRWQLLSEAQMSPQPRRGHTATVVEGRRVGEDAEIPDDEPAAPGTAARSMVVIGGAGPDGKGFEVALGGPVWAMNLETRRWRRLKTTGCVEAAERYEHTATLRQGCIWVVGGLGGRGPALRDVASLDLESLAWTRLELRGPSVAMHGHSAIAVDGDILVLGGHVTLPPKSTARARPARRILCNAYEKDDRRLVVLALDLDADLPAWRVLPAQGEEPPATYGQSACAWTAEARDGPDATVDRTESLVVFGGSHVKPDKDGGALFVGTDLWVFDRVASMMTPPPPETDDGNGALRLACRRAASNRGGGGGARDAEAVREAIVDQRSSNDDLSFFLEQFDLYGGRLPENYPAMKALLRDYARRREASAGSQPSMTTRGAVVAPGKSTSRDEMMARNRLAFEALPRRVTVWEARRLFHKRLSRP